MKSPSIATLSSILLLIFSCADGHDDFLECLSQEFQSISSLSDYVYATTNTSYNYTSILQSSIKNLRFSTPSTPKPHVIITPKHESQIPPLIYCAKQSDLEIRTRSGGHDYEGLSYVSQVPFVVIDLINLSEVTVDVGEKTAWVEAGATIGTLYYRIAEKSLILGFPGGLCPTCGVGGLISGGGYDVLTRKYGMAADNVIDARIVDVNGRILDRESMGEDLFWAIRGGGGASFGVILAWKLQLVDVPKTVTVFSVVRTLEQNATQLVHRWQFVAPNLDKNLTILASLYAVNSNQEGRSRMIQTTFFSLFLGGINELLPLMQESFPELGVVREDCTEMSWINSTIYFAILAGAKPVQPDPLKLLLNRTQNNVRYRKSKADMVDIPIPESGIEGAERLLSEPEADQVIAFMLPLGGRMDEISESSTPFPHRSGTLYILATTVYWREDQAQNSDEYIGWIRRYYNYLTPYVSMFPRGADLNARDLDLGVNNPNGKTSYARASIWGMKYFKNNFDRLVQVKTKVDPENFFRNEQSIPPLDSRCKSDPEILKTLYDY